MCTLWFSVSMADNHWHDLHQVLCPEQRDFENEQEAAKFRRKMARNSPGITDYLFFHRVKVILDTFFGPHGFESDWNWMRFELQGRGAYHAHGCLRLKHDPGFNALSKIVYEGRQAQTIADKNHVHLYTKFPPAHICDDEWDELNEEDFPMNMQFSEQQQEELQATVIAGIQAEKQVMAYESLLLSTMHPHPPVDAIANKRCESTTFVQTETNVHPTALDASLLLDQQHATATNDNAPFVNNLATLLNATERHTL